MADAGLKKAFVIGHPVAHSRSPMIHGYWLKQHGVAGSYERIDVDPDDIVHFIRGLPRSGFAGGNVTIPHKEAVFALADRTHQAAELIGAANTLWLEDGQICADNTDASGFAADLDQRAPEWRKSGSVLVLGAGGAARAVLYALKQAGISDIRVANRTVERAQELADRFGPGISAHPFAAVDELSGDVGLVVNTTSLGLNGEGDLPVDVTRLPEGAVVSDIVYIPLQTPLLAAAAARGLKTVDGLGMLLHQAVPGYERWFGRRPQVTDELRALLIADIEGDAP